MQEMGERTTSAPTPNHVAERMLRVVARAHTSPSGPGYFLAQMGVLGATAFGAWWTVQAVVAGDVAAVAIRFMLASVLGLYYLILARIVRVPQRRS